MDGFVSAKKGKIPDLEFDAVKFLYEDYIVDNTKLLSTGFKYLYPEFDASMDEIAKMFKDGTLEMR